MRALRPFGTVGAMGESIINDAPEGPPDPWKVETSDEPDFFVIDDQLNDYSFWILVETKGKKGTMITLPALKALVDMLRTMPPNWAVGISLLNGYILLFSDRVMVKGPLLENARDIADIVLACQKQS